MSNSALAARLEAVIDEHVARITKLVEAVLDPNLDPMQACRNADAACRLLRASSQMVQELYQQLLAERADGKRAN